MKRDQVSGFRSRVEGSRLEGWKVERLGDVCEVLDSKRKPITKRDRIAGEYPYYGATGILDYVHEYIFDEKLVLIGEDGAKWESGENTAFIAEGKYWVNNHAHVIRPNRAIVLDEWLVYFLNITDLMKFVTGLTVPKLNQEKMRSIPIPLPPLPEQKRIVSLLDETFAALAQVGANAARNLVNAREVFEAELEETFNKDGKGWREEKLGELCERITDGTHVTPKYVSKGVPFLSVKNLTKGFIDFSDTRFITPEEHKILTKRVRPERDDVLYTKVGTTGIAKIVDVDVEFSIFVSVALLKIKHETIFNKYLEYFLNSPFARQQAQKRTRGTANKNLVINDIKEIEIHFPKSLGEQRAIVQRLEGLSKETRRLEAVYRQKMEDVEELRKSVLREAFAPTRPPPNATINLSNLGEENVK